MKYATDFWYSRAIRAQSSGISPVASHGNPKPVDGGRYLCEQTPRREGDMHQVRESYRSRFDSQRKDNHCPSKLKIHSCPPQGPWAELVSGPSRAESSFDIRKRGALLHGSILGWGRGTMHLWGMLRRNSALVAAPRTPAMFPWLLPCTSPSGSPPSPQPWSSLSNHIP